LRACGKVKAMTVKQTVLLALAPGLVLGAAFLILVLLDPGHCDQRHAPLCVAVDGDYR